MINHKSPAWQGAVEVASIRLKTIDEALAKLENLAPDTNGPGVAPTGPAAGDSEFRRSASRNPTRNSVAAFPAAMPVASRQALETYIAGAA